MIANTLTDLRNIARAGARKMQNQGYRAEDLTPKNYRIHTPEAKTYRTCTKPGAEWCTCKFYNENLFNPATKQGFKQGECTCKHIEERKAEEDYIARIEREAERLKQQELDADFNYENGYVAVCDRFATR